MNHSPSRGPNTPRPGDEAPEDIEIELLAETAGDEAAGSSEGADGWAEGAGAVGDVGGGIEIELEGPADGGDEVEREAPLPKIEPHAGKGTEAGKQAKCETKCETVFRGLVGSLVLQMVVAGVAGGLVAFAVQEPGARWAELSHRSRSVAELAYATAVFGGIVGGLIGAALASVEGVVIGAFGHAMRRGIVGLVIGAVGGAIGGTFGQLAYGAMLGLSIANSRVALMVVTMVSRTIGWTLVGASVGVSSGLAASTPGKVVNGLIGGAAGGLIAGVLFDPLAAIISGGSASGTPSRLVGLVVLGGCTGLGVGLVEEITKRVWLTVTSGPLEGKKFIISKPVTRIGSGAEAEIPLVKDRDIAREQCRIEQIGDRHVVKDIGRGVFVNGRAAHNARLRDGDVLRLGQTELVYRTEVMATHAV